MALPTSDRDWVAFLAQLHDRELTTIRQLDAYYEGTQPLSYMHPEIQREVADRIWPLVIFWPQLVVDSVEERLDVVGFRLPGKGDSDEDLWRVWQANDLDEEAQLGRVDALVMRRSYLHAGTNENDADTPLISVESPKELYVYIDPRTRRPLAGLKRVCDPASLHAPEQRYATLYLPGRTVWYDDWAGAQETARDEHDLGELPIVPLVNRARTADRYGRSELNAVIPLSDAANKIATDMMVAAEFHAIPLRALFGVGPADLVDAKGNQMSALQVILGRLLAVGGIEDGRMVQPYEFAASSLTNFHETIRMLASLVASIAGLPPDYLGLTTDNPPSAESRKAGEIRLIKRAERKQVAFGGSYERTMRLVRRLQSGDWDPQLRQMETIWRDASTPTRAQTADAAVKLYNLPKPIVPLRQTREDLGYTPLQIERMEAEDDKAAATDPLGQFARGVALTGAPSEV